MRKLLKLLCVPAVLAATALAAVPAYANHAAISMLNGSCDQGKVCVHIEFTPSDIPPAPATRTITLQLLGHMKTDTTSSELKPIEGATITITVTGDENGKLQKLDKCFENIDTTKFDNFAVKATAGDGIDLSGSVKVQSDKFACTTQSSSAPAPQSSASATATPVAQALAATGGFDYRFPLIGLPILVGGLALLLVTFARGRRSQTK